MMTTIAPDRLAILDTIELKHGSHDSFEHGACVMELSAYLAGEPHGDSPACVSPVIAAFLRRWNDDLPDADRQMLKPYAARVLNTVGPPELETRRAWMLDDWMFRVQVPAWLELAGGDLVQHAVALRALPEICDLPSLLAASPLLQAAQSAAAAWDAARAAARAAAWAAARDAARDAAWAAARDAAWAAAWAAARDAAWAAARDAARAAAWDKLTATKQELQRSALELLDRMIACGGAAKAAPEARP